MEGVICFWIIQKRIEFNIVPRRDREVCTVKILTCVEYNIHTMIEMSIWQMY